MCSRTLQVDNIPLVLQYITVNNSLLWIPCLFLWFIIPKTFEINLYTVLLCIVLWKLILLCGCEIKMSDFSSWWFLQLVNFVYKRKRWRYIALMFGAHFSVGNYNHFVFFSCNQPQYYFWVYLSIDIRSIVSVIVKKKIGEDFKKIQSYQRTCRNLLTPE